MGASGKSERRTGLEARINRLDNLVRGLAREVLFGRPSSGSPSGSGPKGH
jgi:hypothetical protein